MVQDAQKDKLHQEDFGSWSHPEGSSATEISRRTFLSRFRDAVGSFLFLSNVPKWASDKLVNFAQRVDEGGATVESEENQESANKVIIDLTFTDERQVLAQVLGENDRSEQIGVGTDVYKVHRSEYFVDGDPDVVKTALLQAMLESRQGHGQRMLDVSGDEAEDLGYQPRNPDLLPLESAITFQLLFDELHNPIGQLNVSEVVLEGLLRQYFRQNPDQKIVNMSFQVGIAQELFQLREIDEPIVSDVIVDNGVEDVQMFYFGEPDGFIVSDKSEYPGSFVPYRWVDGKEGLLTLLSEDEVPLALESFRAQALRAFLDTGDTEGVADVNPPRIVQTEAYNERFAKSNLHQLVELCRKYSNKLFICAGGNENNNFYWVRQELMAEYFEQGESWPDNLLLVGALNGNGENERTEADGCDLYLRAGDFDYDVLYSSDATAIVSTIADVILRNYPNFSAKALRRILMSSQFSREIDLSLLPTLDHPDSQTVTALCVDPQLVSDHLQVQG